MPHPVRRDQYRMMYGPKAIKPYGPMSFYDWCVFAVCLAVAAFCYIC